MQDLKLAPDHFLFLFEGTKCATIQSGSIDILKGSLALESTDGGWGVIVNVKEVRHKKLSEVTQREAKQDGHDDIASLNKRLSYFYPKITPNSDITVVLFDFKDPLEIPEDVWTDLDKEFSEN